MNNKIIAMYVSLMESFNRMKKSERGQTIVEYGLILVLIAIVAIAAMGLVGGKANNAFSKAASALQ